MIRVAESAYIGSSKKTMASPETAASNAIESVRVEQASSSDSAAKSV